MTAPSLDHLRGLLPHLHARIRGQDHVLPRLASVLNRAALGLPRPDRPLGVVLLVGPTGSGKSESFRCGVRYAFGPDALHTVDCSELQGDDAIRKFIGEHRQDPGLLGLVLRRVSHGALLLDEVEKAHVGIHDLLLQMFGEGRITVATRETFDLTRFVIGLTSNIGADESLRMEHSRFASIEQATLRRVSETLRRELVGRIDEKLVFARLSPAVQREICALEVRRETDRLRSAGFDLQVSPAALEFLLREGFHPQLGARPLRQTVDRRLQDLVVEALFAQGTARGRVEVASSGNSLVLVD
jgi:ATP-dependent Clp protease ATP-binding subunit ClpA